MEIKEIEKLLERNSKVILKIKHKGRNYIKVLAREKDNIEYRYYEVLEKSIMQVEDKNLLEYFSSIYETKENNIVY